jgi:hypothetical protein
MTPTLSTLLFFRWIFYKGGGLPEGQGQVSAFEFAVLCLIVVILMVFVYYRVTKVLERKSIPGAKPVKLIEPLPAVYKSILSEKSNYYNTLGKADKELFEKRVRYYMNSKMFTSEDGYAIIDEMKVMISATAVQITFGLPMAANSNYTHVLVMPNAQMTPRTATRNSIVVPWREFVEGYAQHDDGQNEGLKVMASALIKDNRLQDKAYKFLSEKKLEKWEKISVEEADNFMSGMFENIKTDDRLKDEYFAQAVVYFFELPVAFKAKYTALFEAMSELLGQDTVKKIIKR